MTTERSLELRPEGGSLTQAGLDHTRDQLLLLESFVKKVLHKDEDYGVIPGTNNKPTLLKPGAANITAAFNCHAEPLIDQATLDHKEGFVSYEAHVDLVSNLSGNVMARGFGNCNSYEAKYRFRWAGRGEERKRVENDNPLELANTIKKMAIKRAEVDAAMRLPGVARFFTQDLEDMGHAVLGTTVEGPAQAVGDWPGACPDHNKPFRPGKQGGWYCPMKTAEGWCKQHPAPKPGAEPKLPEGMQDEPPDDSVGF